MLMNRNSNYILFYVFLHYALLKLKVLAGTTFKWKTLADQAMKDLIKHSHNEEYCYVDCNSSILANVKCFKVSTPTWLYVCSVVSLRKYKVLVVPLNDTGTNEIWVSEVTRHNIESALHCDVTACFLCRYQENT